MKPLYLLLLLLMACGFFACTTDITQDTTEILPVPEGKTLNANDFAEFTSFLVEFDVFVESAMREDAGYGAGDFRLYFDHEEELLFDPLTEGSYLPSSAYTDPLDALPSRYWASSITLGFTPDSANRLSNWLNKNFNNRPSLDLRIALLENGTLLFQGVPTTEKDLTDFPETSWF